MRPGPSYFHHGIEGGIGQQQGVRIGQADILGGTDHHSAGNKLGVFPTLYHAGHPVEGGIGVAATDALDEGRYDIIVHLAVFVVGQRILLQTADNKFVGDDHLAGIGRFHDELQDVEQLTGIASAIAQDGSGLLERDLALLQEDVLGDGPMEQLEKVFFSNDFNT